MGKLLRATLRSALILLAPFQRLPDDFVFIRAGEMPLESLDRSRVDKCGKRRPFRTPPGVQLDRKMALIDASLKRRRTPFYMINYRRKQRNLQLLYSS